MEEKLGGTLLRRLYQLVSQGTLTKLHIERMSDHHNMDVATTFNERREGESIEVTMERMLDRWYEDTVCNLSSSEASERLTRILKDTCSPVLAEKIGKPASVCERYNVESKPKGGTRSND